jgi:hypothetical protein
VAEWHWECITDDLLDGLPPEALRAAGQLGKELAVRESMVFPGRPGIHRSVGDPGAPSPRTARVMERDWFWLADGA